MVYDSKWCKSGEYIMAELKYDARASDLVDDYNALIYIINSVVRNVNTADLVRVLSVDPATNTLSVIPVVREANADGEMIEETPIFGIRYFQWQFGQNAIKGTPEIGDIGLIVTCRKDISSPESGMVQTYRQYCPSDSIYIGGIFGLNIAPTQYIEFTQNGINVTTLKDVNITCDKATVTATTSADITAPAINLGGPEGMPIAIQGGRVTSDGTSSGSTVGFIAEGSQITKSL